MGFFDAPSHVIILLVVVLVLFGSSRLPGAAKALGQSMNIFKRSVKGLDEDQQPDQAKVTQGTVVPPAPLASSEPAPPAQQARIDELQRQISDLQQAKAADQQHDTRPA